jgi:hypothetical protein
MTKQDFSDLYCHTNYNVENFTNELSSRITSIYDELISEKELRVNINNAKWITNELLSFIKTKNYYYKKYRKAQNSSPQK